MDIQYIDKYEQALKEGLHTFLKAKEEVDEMLPDAPDIEERWEVLAQSYLQDGVREFAGYPTVSLGWMMYVGMSVAALWDDDWEVYSKIDDLYVYMRDKRGYDNMDEYIREEILCLKDDAYEETERLVNDCATMTLRRLQHEGFEPGSPLAFHAYVRSLHQLYLMGAAVQLRRMGYHMERMG